MNCDPIAFKASIRAIRPTLETPVIDIGAAPD